MIDTIEFANDKTPCEFDFPSECPHCLKVGHPEYLVANSRFAVAPNDENKRIVSVTFLCPSCGDTYFAKYKETTKKAYKLTSIYPAPTPMSNIPIEIEKYFPDFFEIYRQSLIAEGSALTEICGMGYRKAIEYLVKKYLIEKYPNVKIDIENEPLGRSVERIDSVIIKNLAKATTWLGNDQVHMIKKHKDYNIEHIKQFTVALCHHIMMEKIAEDASVFVQKK